VSKSVLLKILVLVSLIPLKYAAAADRTRLLAPIESRRNHYFHSSLGVPYLEGAETMPKGTFSLRFRSDHAKNEKGPPISGPAAQEILLAGGDFEDYFLGTIHEWVVVESAYGLTPCLEVRARIGYGGWAEHEDHFYFLDEQNRGLVLGENNDLYGLHATGRDDDFIDANAGLKWKIASRLVRGGRQTLSAAVDVKMPLGQENNLVDGGTTDLGLKIMAGWVFDRWAFHTFVGYMHPFGDMTLFEDYAGVDPDPVWAAGVGVMYALTDTLAVGLQFEGNTGAFGEVPFLDGNPISMFGGIRKAIGPWMFEAGGGMGLNDDSYDFQFMAAASFWF
jgi:hypothetical protein